jgi:hypothetical protein
MFSQVAVQLLLHANASHKSRQTEVILIIKQRVGKLTHAGWTEMVWFIIRLSLVASLVKYNLGVNQDV